MPGYHNWYFALGDAWLSGKTINVALLTSSYTPDLDHANYSDLTNEVAAGNGYTTGGAEVTNPAFADDDANDRATFDGDDVAWPNSSITARYGAIYYDSGVEATSTLIGYIDFGGDETSVNANFTIQWDAVGICYFNNA